MPVPRYTRINLLEDQIRQLTAALEAHASWLGDLQRGTSDTAAAIQSELPGLRAETGRNVE